jgi:hypothetical protein
LYGFGEIILVVIGILIALAINNANQRRIVAEKEQAYLVGLQSEFQSSRKKLETLLQVNRKNYEGAKQLLQLLDQDQPLPEEAVLSKLLFDSFAFEIAYNPNNSLLVEMINSGSLKDISNPELRIYLTSWESILESVRIQEADLRTQREAVRDLFRSSDGSIRTIFDGAGLSKELIGLAPATNPRSNVAILRSAAFENSALMFILTSMSAESSHYHPLLTEIDSILVLIAEALD